MCGIVGIAGFEDKALLKRMCTAIAHRGPDDEGLFFDKGIGLGHRRLSIIDLAGGHQPMSNEDGSVWVVFNGEIFNFRTFRKELEKKGHTFKTNSDTEVLVHGYEEFGIGFVNKLRGMFAFAIWDGAKKRLMLARDRLGINPLYYYFSEGSMVFASEIKAILEDRGIKREMDVSALRDYLAFQATVGPRTMFEGIRELLPGHTLVFERGNITVSEYWDLKNFNYSVHSEAEALNSLLCQLRDAVSCHLESDVPIALYLSGGVDSSTLLALMHETYRGRVHAFSVGFGYAETDELLYARLAAEKFESTQNEIIIEPEMVLRDMREIITLLEEPIADFGEFANFYLSRELSRRGIKVALSGGGSDEMFAGYHGHPRMATIEKARGLLPEKLRKNILPALSHKIPLYLPKSLGINTYAEILADDFYKTNGQLFPTVYERNMLLRGGNEKKTEGSERIRGYYLNPAIPKEQYLTRAQYVDMKVYVDGHLLHVDKMNLGHALEVRYPLLDYRLVEFAFTLPERFRIMASVEKYLIRKAAQKLGVPQKIIWKKKKGFRSPLEHWLSGEMREYVRGVLDKSEFISKRFNREYIRFLMSRTCDHWYAHKVWGLMVLALWHETYFE